MRQTLSRGVLAAAAAATGVLSLSCGSALADSDATGVTSDSDGIASGNVLQAPVHAPVDLCGNTVSAGAVLNRSFGHSCAHDACEPADSSGDSSTDSSGGSGYGTDDEGTAASSVSGARDADDCASPAPSDSPTPPPTRTTESPRPAPEPPRSTAPKPTPAGHEEPAGPPQLAETGEKTMVAASTAGAALIAGGILLYRRGRAAARR
ncbi:chaplin [Streptomyces sp. NPDC004065]|uniref:chaplin n=1 Tax=Streptomyces sp. NPDC004065 TaxID=3364689 RepID=UPI00384CBB4E